MMYGQKNIKLLKFNVLFTFMRAHVSCVAVLTKYLEG
jgi:hypothetical protein